MAVRKVLSNGCESAQILSRWVANRANAIPAVSPLMSGGLAAAVQPPLHSRLLALHSALLPLGYPTGSVAWQVKPFSFKMQHLYRQILPLLPVTCIRMVFASAPPIQLPLLSPYKKLHFILPSDPLFISPVHQALQEGYRRKA